MNDYSKFIKSAFGFVKNYEIENGEVFVVTSRTKKGEPHRYPTNKAMYFEKRLENQFKMLINHQDEIVEYNRKQQLKYAIPFLTVLAAIETFLLIIFGFGLITAIGIGSIILTSGIIALAINKSESKFRDKVKQYDRYLKNRHIIEQSAEKDANVTQHLNDKTLSLIEKNKKLKQQGIIEDAFNAHLMDQMSLNELKKLLLRYKISEGLEQTQTFSIPSEIEQPSRTKKRTLTPPKNQQLEHND